VLLSSILSTSSQIWLLAVPSQLIILQKSIIMSPFDIEKSFHYQEAKHITLTLQESTIEAFFNEFNSNHTGLVSRSTIVERLLHVYKALVPTPQQYHLLHPSRAEHLQAFLDCLFDGDLEQYDLQHFKSLVHLWQLPALSTSAHPATVKGTSPTHTLFQRLRSRWATNGHRYCFILAVVCFQIGMAMWQLLTFLHVQTAKDAFVSRI
jgi:hypothetical protein